MRQKARIRVRLVGYKPRILLAEPYYTLVTVATTAAGALGAFASVIGGASVVVGEGVISPLLGAAVVLLLVFLGGELVVVRVDSPISGVRNPRCVHLKARVVVGRRVTESISRILNIGALSEVEIPALGCWISGHAYQPQGMTTKDRLGLTPRDQPPRMVWTCARCGDEQWLTPGISPAHYP
ncbi:MAG TPA: hypothetical protein VFJ06_13790 [Halococcus sp.]|nr:hypothetical protein [Halococcus sp.]